MPGLSSTTAAGLARRMTSDQWRAVETGLAVVTERLVGMLPAARAAAQTEGPVIGGLVASRIVTRQRERLAIILGLLFFGVFVALIGLSPVFIAIPFLTCLFAFSDSQYALTHASISERAELKPAPQPGDRVVADLDSGSPRRCPHDSYDSSGGIAIGTQREDHLTGRSPI